MIKVIVATCLILASVSIVEATPKNSNDEIVFSKTRVLTKSEMLSMEDGKSTNELIEKKSSGKVDIQDWNHRVTRFISNTKK